MTHLHIILATVACLGLALLLNALAFRAGLRHGRRQSTREHRRRLRVAIDRMGRRLVALDEDRDIVTGEFIASLHTAALRATHDCPACSIRFEDEWERMLESSEDPTRRAPLSPGGQA